MLVLMIEPGKAPRRLELSHSLEEMQSLNEILYRDILPANYGKSYADPAYAVENLGEDMGRDRDAQGLGLGHHPGQ